ncbi:MAG: alanine racemase [Spirochaetaceae bacterium]|nr:alanine racemase [Spirochaetaceae bacterium]
MPSFTLPGRPVWAEIDLSAITANIETIKGAVGPGTRLCAVVKADAYGHGAVRVAEEALAAGADLLAVAMASEAVALRKAGIEAPLLVLGHTPAALADLAAEWNFSATVSSIDEAQALAEAGRSRGKTVGLHLKIDTGMARLGFDPRAAAPAAVTIAGLDGVRIEGAFSHLATADSDSSFAHKQLARFLETIADIEALGVRIPLRHIANSAAALAIPEARLDMVRAGISLYGFQPGFPEASPLGLKPAMRLVALVSQVRDLREGDSVGYGRKFRAPRRSRIAVLPLGYADGLRRNLSGKASVGTAAGRAPLVGTICMDQCMIDATDLPGLKPGDAVDVFGGGGPSAEELAGILGSISYEVLSTVGQRVPRIYVNGSVG